MERNFKGIWIPKEIWETKDLNILEKIILVEIDSLENEETGCYASNKYFADFFDISNGRISQIINNLKKKDYINVEYEYNGKEIKKRIIRINKPPYPEVFRKLNTYLENDDRGIKFSKEGYLENDKDNNININNTNINNNKKEKIKKEKKKYGEFENVLLTDEEYQKIKEKDLIKYIDRLSIYIESKGTKYKSHYATILNWSRKEKNVIEEKTEWFDKDIKIKKTSREKLEEMKNMLKDFT